MRWHRLFCCYCIVVCLHWVRVSCLVISEGPFHHQDQSLDIEVDLFDSLEGFERYRSESWDTRVAIPTSIEDRIKAFIANRTLGKRALPVVNDTTPNYDKAYFLHIPKTGGHSFDTDGREIFRSMNQGETCFSEVASETLVTFFRDPQLHVVSQYWHCVGAGFSVPGLGKWANEWAKFMKSEPLHNMTDKHRKEQMRYPCFNPINKQTQKMTCVQQDRYPDVIDVDLAIRNMNSVHFVGLLELYRKSLCVFHAKTSGKMPSSCDCRRRDEAGFWHHNFGFNHHRLPKNESILKDLDALTQADRALYDAASARFMQDLREVEMRHGVEILCMP
ncbi:unnamed protein product [Prorocentrum cordatum]|uniref:Uncharacterized protein n=1 Tax=Prorocentrum cordatum TaxID=2364126 RepID=A0ABN9S8D6_9DINO|nr:unnamed protein product [Polarella glacialis]